MKSNVYDFGVVLLELISGRRVIDENRPEQKRNLMVWAAPYLRNKRKVSKIMDSRLGGEYPREKAHKVAIIIYECVCLDTKLRPTMSKVVTALESIMQ